MAVKSRQNALNKASPSVKSFTPIVSRVESIDSCGQPISIVHIPVLALIIGPMVLPHPQSFHSTNSYIGGNLALSASSRISSPVTPFVAYR